YTRYPKDRSSSCLDSCNSLAFFPGAFTSTKPILPPGKRTILSGRPSNPGAVHLGQIPPAAFTAFTSFCSTVFSLIYPPISRTAEPKIPYARIYTRCTRLISIKNTIYLYYKEIDVLPFFFTSRPPVKSGFFQEQPLGTEQASVPFPSAVPLSYPFRLYILC